MLEAEAWSSLAQPRCWLFHLATNSPLLVAVWPWPFQRHLGTRQIISFICPRHPCSSWYGWQYLRLSQSSIVLCCEAEEGLAPEAQGRSRNASQVMGRVHGYSCCGFFLTDPHPVYASAGHMTSYFSWALLAYGYMTGREKKYKLVLWCQSKRTFSSVFGIGLWAEQVCPGLVGKYLVGRTSAVLQT